MRSPRKQGFTLLELLVVIAIIMLLVALLMPALNGGSMKAKEVKCLSNMRQLSTAWMSYANEHDGVFVCSDTGLDVITGIYHPAPLIMWVRSGNDKASLDQGNLWPYVKDYTVYHCPLDASGNGINSSNNHLRSYSISGRLSGNFRINNDTELVSTAEAQPKLTPAASALLFIEEDDFRGYNQGSWVINTAPSTQWIDYVPAWHQNGINLTFCDGHAEHWTWIDPGTKDLATKVKQFGASATATNTLNDLKRLQKVYKP